MDTVIENEHKSTLKVDKQRKREQTTFKKLDKDFEQGRITLAEYHAGMDRMCMASHD